MRFKDVNGLIRNNYFGIEFCKEKPTHAVRFAKNHFKDKNIVIIEIGVLYGDNALDILKHLNVGFLYLIDPFESYIDGNNVKSEKVINEVKEIAIKNLSKFDNVKLLELTSDEALKPLKDEDVKADFIYIDGLHTYEQVKKDMYNYWELLKEGGVMAGDNITTPIFTKNIFKALAEFCVDKKVDAIITRTDWIIEKGVEE